jgi:hypothetical protein
VLGEGRALLSDVRRRRLAEKGKILGRKLLAVLASIVTLDMPLRWHRELAAKKWDFSSLRKRIGRPHVSEETVSLVVQKARENPTWGYDHIVGALKNIGVSFPTAPSAAS